MVKNRYTGKEDKRKRKDVRREKKINNEKRAR